jgi:hypothetical protein
MYHLTRILPPELVQVIRQNVDDFCLSCHVCGRGVLRNRKEYFFNACTDTPWVVEGNLLVSRDVDGKVLSYRWPCQSHHLMRPSAVFVPDESPTRSEYVPSAISVGRTLYPNTRLVLEQTCYYFFVCDDVICAECHSKRKTDDV